MYDFNSPSYNIYRSNQRAILLRHLAIQRKLAINAYRRNILNNIKNNPNFFNIQETVKQSNNSIENKSEVSEELMNSENPVILVIKEKNTTSKIIEEQTFVLNELTSKEEEYLEEEILANEYSEVNAEEEPQVDFTKIYDIETNIIDLYKLN